MTIPHLSSLFHCRRYGRSPHCHLLWSQPGVCRPHGELRIARERFAFSGHPPRLARRSGHARRHGHLPCHIGRQADDPIGHPAANSDRRSDDLAVRHDKARHRCRAATVALYRSGAISCVWCGEGLLRRCHYVACSKMGCSEVRGRGAIPTY